MEGEEMIREGPEPDIQMLRFSGQMKFNLIFLTVEISFSKNRTVYVHSL
jgi:hypothetical protein